MQADVVIVGGGLVGATLAAALTLPSPASPLSVILVEPNPPPNDSTPPPPSLRTSTITPTSQSHFEDLGIWSALPPHRVAPVTDIFVYDVPHAVNDHHPDPHHPSTQGLLHFNSPHSPTDILASVVDNQSLLHAIYSRLYQAPSSLTIHQSSLSSIHFPGPVPEPDHTAHSVPWPVVKLQDGSQISARLIAACDGPRSRVRSLADAEWYTHSYGQTAVVSTVRVADASSTAFQRFVSTGPVALLPVAAAPPPIEGQIVSKPGEDGDGPFANVVWSTTTMEAQALLQADDKQFLDELNVVLTGHEEDDGRGNVGTWSSSSHAYEELETLGKGVRKLSEMLGGGGWSGSGVGGDSPTSVPVVPEALSVMGERKSFPLTLGYAPRYVLPRRRTVLVGDAAHVVHPLAGQGVNLGIGDATALAEVMRRAADTGRDVGGEGGMALRAYEAERLPVNAATSVGLHALAGVFAKRGLGRGVRRAGMSAIDALAPVKRAILRVMR